MTGFLSRILIPVALMATVTWSCNAHRPLDVSRLPASPVCRPRASGPSLTWIATAAQWKQWRAANTMPEKGVGPPGALLVDFATHGILVIRHGTRPSVGTQLSLNASESTRKGSTAMVRIRLTPPIHGGRTAQMTIAPCLLLRLERAGLTAIRVEDANNREVGTVPIPKAAR